MKELNIRKIYDRTPPQESEDVQLDITLFHVLVFDLIKETLAALEGSKEVDNYTVDKLYIHFIKLIRASETDGIQSDDILTVIDDTSKDLMQEFKTHEDPVRAMCYLIGTNSEVPQNYTMTERMIIVTAMLRFYGLNLIF